jgi:uncharacterized protein involved in type VI secretion and phage assembly
VSADVFSQLLGADEADARCYGVVVGVVTNNQDPEKLGRVQLRLPWMDEKVQSPWARVASPMSGKDRGLWLLPEVDDEVLVAFEHGSPDTPYVLGGLWNGQDTPPATNEDGKNDERFLKSRSGHVIRLSDKSGEEHIEIVDKSAKNKIVISTKDDSITVEASGDITIKAGGTLKLSGRDVEVTSTAAAKVEAGQGMDLKASAQLNVKGAMVNIN